MGMKLLNHATPTARKALNLAVPTFVVGLLMVSQSYGLVSYPPGQPGTLERTVDSILAKEQVDILRENQLITTQNAIVGVINVLNRKLDNTTDPNQRALIEQQIAAKQAQYQGFQQALNVNTVALQKNLSVLNPIKDSSLRTLGGLPRPRKQIEMFIAAAIRREQNSVTYIRNYLKAHPVSPTSPF